MRRRAICVSQAEEACAKVTRAVALAGLDVDHVDSIAGLSPDCDAALVVIDRAARHAAGEALRGLAMPVIVIGDDLDDDGLLALMVNSSVSHLVRDPDNPDLAITSQKLVTGDLFGLEKYVAAGTPITERAVGDQLAKHRAVHEVCAWAEGVGARRSLLHRIQSAVDELLMNGLRFGAARVRWASDDDVIAVSVADEVGELRQRDFIDHVRRARQERGRPNPLPGGAGLGLYLVLANVSALIINVEPHRRTEVVCVFDKARHAVAAARSLHVFAARSA